MADCWTAVAVSGSESTINGIIAKGACGGDESPENDELTDCLLTTGFEGTISILTGAGGIDSSTSIP